MTSTLFTVLVTIFASSGFWTLILAIYNNRQKAKSAETELLLGLAHDRIYELCKNVLKTGELSDSEYDNLRHLYDPYIKMGGNGTAERLMKEVEDLKITLEVTK